MRRRRRNPITSEQVVLVVGGAVGGVLLYNWYKTQQAAQANANTFSLTGQVPNTTAPTTSSLPGSPNTTGQ